MAKLESILQDFLSMNPEQQIEKVREIRRNKYTVKPAATKRKVRAARKKKPKIRAGLSKLSKDDLAELLKEFGG